MGNKDLVLGVDPKACVALKSLVILLAMDAMEVLVAKLCMNVP